MACPPRAAEHWEIARDIENISRGVWISGGILRIDSGKSPMYCTTLQPSRRTLKSSSAYFDCPPIDLDFASYNPDMREDMWIVRRTARLF